MNQIISPASFIGVNNALVPCEGPRAIRVPLDFTQAQAFDVDLSNLQARGFVSMIQSVFIDNSTNASTLTLTINGSGQSITVKANTQTYVQVLCPNPPKFTASSTGNVNSVVIDFLNFPVNFAQWQTV